MKKVGLLGGGQLGKMILPHAHRLDIQITVLDSADCVCAEMTHHHIVGDFKNPEDVKKLADQDAVTIEIEHVSVEGLRKLEAQAVRVAPSSMIVELIQDKGLQKKFLKDQKIPTATFEIKRLSETDIFSNDVVVKLCRGGYDGKGVWIPKDGQSVPMGFQTEVVIEPKIEIEKEVSVIVARCSSGAMATYPVVEMVFNSELNLIDSTFCPANITQEQSQQATELAQKVAQKLEIVGVLAVEMFITKEGKLLVNELAPRVHNSGHFTIEACYTDQFEQHLRAVANLPLGKCDLREPGMTINIIGAAGYTGETTVSGLDKILEIPKVYVHLYGKNDCRPGRKMGHVTILGDREHCLKIKKEVEKWLVVKGMEKLA